MNISKLRWNFGPRNLFQVRSSVGFPGLRVSFTNGLNSHDLVHLGLSVASHKFLELFVVVSCGLSRCKVYERYIPLFGGTELCNIRFIKDRVLLTKHF